LEIRFKKRESPLAEAFSLGEANFGLSSEERREILVFIPYLAAEVKLATIKVNIWALRIKIVRN